MSGSIAEYDPKPGKHHVSRDRIRHRMLLSSGNAAIRILERQVAAQVDAVVERGRLHRDLLEDRTRIVVVDRVRGAHRGAAVAADVPRGAEARREVQPLLVQPRLALGEPGIAGIDEAGRRVDVHRALDALAEVVEDEVGDGAVVEVRPEVRLPPKAGVERQAVHRPPRVLRVQPEVPLVVVEDARRAVLQPAHLPGEEVGQRQGRTRGR